MDTLTSLRVFRQVAENGSFAAAAERVGVSPAMASKHVAHLERRLRARLFHRSSRHVSLTEAGDLFYESCRVALDSLDGGAAALSEGHVEPRGQLKVTAPVWCATASFTALLAAYRRRHPQVLLDLRLSNEKVDLAEGAFDLALRVSVEAAVRCDPDRPYGWACRDRVVQAALMHGHAPHAPLRLREAPCIGVLGIEGGTGDVDLLAVVRDLAETAGSAAARAMIEAVDHRAVMPETVDQAGIQIGDEELPARAIEYDVAEAGAAVAGNACEQADFAGLAVDLVDAPGAAGAKLSGHPRGARLARLKAIGLAIAIGVGTDNAETERGRGREINARHAAVVERDAEHLPDIACLDLVGRRHRDHLALGRPSGNAEPHDLRRGAVEIDIEVVERIGTGRRRRIRGRDPRKAGYDGISGGEDAGAFGTCSR